MKKILLTLTFCGLTLIAKSQTASVEQSTYGIQTGVFWRSSNLKRIFMTPVIRLEPRWYYNLTKEYLPSNN
jgi:hypothetical protein